MLVLPPSSEKECCFIEDRSLQQCSPSSQSALAHGSHQVLKLLAGGLVPAWPFRDWTRVGGGAFGTVYVCSTSLGRRTPTAEQRE